MTEVSGMKYLPLQSQIITANTRSITLMAQYMYYHSRYPNTRARDGIVTLVVPRRALLYYHRRHHHPPPPLPQVVVVYLLLQI